MSISNATMTSDQDRHTGRQVPDRQGWEVSWLPGQVLDRNAAITTMTLAAAGAITRASGPHEKTSDQEPAVGRADPGAGP